LKLSHISCPSMADLWASTPCIDSDKRLDGYGLGCGGGHLDGVFFIDSSIQPSPLLTRRP
jgi:hypothetical protein